MTSFLRSQRLTNLWYLRFRRKFGTFRTRSENSCHPRTESETSIDDDPCPPCPPPPMQDPSCPRLKLSNCHPDADPRKLAFWRMLSLFVALPLVVIMSVVTYVREQEKAKRPREPFLDLPYMCRRTKPFPWGDGNHTFFHNPVKNPVPSHGYEVEDPNAIVYKKTSN